MFYHQEILQRRGGKFGTVWLAATKIEQLKRRDFCSVNIKRTCEDILDYILVRRLGKHGASGHPRFSLYLSSQLMFGVLRVYRRQNQYLLDDVTTFFCQMKTLATLEEIDMKAITRQEQMALDFDINADNPWFGALHVTEGVLPISRQGSDSSQLSPSPIIIKETLLKADLTSPHTVTSKEEITIPEIDMSIFQDQVMIQHEQDLLPFDGKEMEGILENPLPEELQMSLFLSPIKVPQYEEQQIDLPQGILSPKEKTPMTKPDKTSVPERRQVEVTPGITPAPEPLVLRPRRPRPSFTLQLSPVPPSPRRQRKRRHLCIDIQTQLSKDELKENFKERDDILRPFVLPDTRRSSVQDLFSNPGHSGMRRNNKVLQLWRRNAVYGILETESDIEQPAWSVPNLTDESRPTRSKRRLVEPRESPELQRQEQAMEHQVPQEEIPMDVQANLEQTLQVEETLPVIAEQPSVEVARDNSMSLEKSRELNDSSLSVHQRSTVSEPDKSRELEKSKTKERKSGRKSKTRGSVSIEEEMEVNLVQEQSMLQELSSVMEEKEVPITPGPLPVIPMTGGDLYRLIRQNTENGDFTSFQTLCPPDRYNRKQATAMFVDLLGLCKNRVIRTEQDSELGDIYIWRSA